MRFFRFSVDKNIRDFTHYENGWKYNFKMCLKFSFASLKSPILKEVTYSKGPTVRYVRHNIFCVGFIKDKSIFYGISFFDLPIRPLIALFICLGVLWVSSSVSSGIIWSFLFYFLISVLSINNDELLTAFIKRKLQS